MLKSSSRILHGDSEYVRRAPGEFLFTPVPFGGSYHVVAVQGYNFTVSPAVRVDSLHPMPAMTSTYNLIQLKTWAEKSGIPFWTTPQAKNTVDNYDGRGKCRRCNTCEICPTGARYSPDWTFKQLLELNRAGDGAARKIQPSPAW